MPVKSVAQQSLATLHRFRSGWMTERTARINAVRGLLRELGIFIPVGSREVIPAVWAQIEDADSELPAALRRVFAEACQEIRDIEARIKKVDHELAALTPREHSSGLKRRLGRISKRGDGYLRTLLIHGARSLEQVGPAQGKPRTIVALEAAVNDWLPCARIPSWPGAPGSSTAEARDTFAVRPVSPS